VEDSICAIYRAAAARVPVVFDHREVAHLDCYIQAEGAARLVRNCLERRPDKTVCYTCLARHWAKGRQDIENAVTGLRLMRNVVVEPGICSVCNQAQVTIRLRPAAERSVGRKPPA
jgi:hypothetical protein